MWLDKAELGEIVRQTNVGEKLASKDRGKYSVEAHCHSCQCEMKQINFAHDSGVFLYKCNECGGSWVWDGQIEQIAQYRRGSPGINRLSNAFADELQPTAMDKLEPILRSRLLLAIIVGIHILVAVYINPFLLILFIIHLWIPIFCVLSPRVVGRRIGILYGLRATVTKPLPSRFVLTIGWFWLISTLLLVLICSCTPMATP